MNTIRHILQIRRAEPALHSGSLELIDGLPGGLLGYLRRSGTDEIAVFLNFSGVQMKLAPRGGQWQPIFKLSDADDFQDGAITLGPYGGHHSQAPCIPDHGSLDGKTKNANLLGFAFSLPFCILFSTLSLHLFTNRLHGLIHRLRRHPAIRQAALRHVRTPAPAAADGRDQVACLEVALDQVFGHHRDHRGSGRQHRRAVLRIFLAELIGQGSRSVSASAFGTSTPAPSHPFTVWMFASCVLKAESAA